MTTPVIIGDCYVWISGDETKVTTVYGLYGSEDKIMYVGSTSGPLKRRVAAHIRDMRAGSLLPVHVWMREHSNVGFKFSILDTVVGQSGVSAEKIWISRCNPPLNLTDGGKGMSGHRFAGTEHAKRIQAALRSGDYFTCQKCGERFWRKRVEIAKGHNKFCSRLCSNSRHRAGENHAS